jgi:hypothetical protein
MSVDAVAAEQQRFMVRVYNWMTAGLAITGFMAFYVSSNEMIMNIIFGNPFIFVVYTSASITSTFLVTAGTFGAMSLYGYTTKKDLTSWGSFLFMGLIGIIIASVVNIFMQSSMMHMIITYAGVLIFVGLTAYDTQKIKEMNILGNEGTDEDTKEAIRGALTLYLDFINLFLMLLRLMGDRR